MTARASILIPTHDGTVLLQRAVSTALRQTVAELEVIIVGDGVTDVCRATIVGLCATDARVRFLDLPKMPRHGEANRDAGVRSATSEAVFYLADDDLLLPGHVESLLPLLESAHLVHCANVAIESDGELVHWATDLRHPATHAWMLQHPPRNCVGLTGSAHRRSTYLTLETGWQTTPPGESADHFLWKKFVRQPGFSGATSPLVTAITFPSLYRRHLSAEQFTARHRGWFDLISGDDAQGRVTALAAEAARDTLVRLHRLSVDTGLALENAMHVIGEQQRQIEALQAVIEVPRLAPPAEKGPSRLWGRR